MDEVTRPIAIFNAYDQNDVDLYAHASATSAVLFQIQNQIRQDWKYGGKPEPVYKYIEDFRGYINKLCSENHLPQ